MNPVGRQVLETKEKQKRILIWFFIVITDGILLHLATYYLLLLYLQVLVSDV